MFDFRAVGGGFWQKWINAVAPRLLVQGLLCLLAVLGRILVEALRALAGRYEGTQKAIISRLCCGATDLIAIS